MVVNWAVSEIDLPDAGFWGLPPAARDAAFGVLRRERPVAFFSEPALPLLPPDPGSWALTRCEDIARASREPGIFSGQQLAAGDKVMLFYPSANRDPQWLRSSAINCIKRLPVRFTPSRPGG